MFFEGGYKKLARNLIIEMGPGYGAFFFILMVVITLPISIILWILYPLGKLLETWSKEDN